MWCSAGRVGKSCGDAGVPAVCEVYKSNGDKVKEYLIFANRTTTSSSSSFSSVLFLRNGSSSLTVGPAS